jgi:hypothetical protein
VRAAAYLVLTPFFLFLGWSTLAGALVAATGQAEATSAKVLVSVSTLLMLPLGAAFGWRHRHRSLRLPARLILTPILLSYGFWFLVGLIVLAAGQQSRADGTLVTIVALITLLTIPLGIGLAWRYRERSLRLPAHLILTPVVLYFGWWLLWVLLLWSTGQESLVYGPVGTIILVISVLTIPLGIALGWLRYRRP